MEDQPHESHYIVYGLHALVVELELGLVLYDNIWIDPLPSAVVCAMQLV